MCRKHGISDATFYKWKARYGGMEVSDARRLKGLEDENAKLKKLLATHSGAGFLTREPARGRASTKDHPRWPSRSL